jgi:hypothetical protein
MATQAYYDWVRAGKPWHKSVPVAEYQRAFLAAGWPALSLGTLGDEAHLTADRPQDHTPFSVTGWPGASPYPYVLAFDAGHAPSQGFDMGPVVARWLADARDGKTPWVKYIVWRGQLYDVRRDWAPSGASGHYDHAHVSFRTDWYGKSIGGYPVVNAGGSTMGMTPEVFIQTGLTQAGFSPGPIDGDLGPNSLAAFVTALKTKGAQGEPGAPGAPGKDGKDGRTPTLITFETQGKVIAYEDDGAGTQ